MGSVAGQGKDGKEVTTITTYFKALCIVLIQKLVSFYLRDNHSESQQVFQVWDNRKITTWPAKPQLLGDHVINYTTELSVSGMDNSEHTKGRSVSYMDNSNDKRRGALTELNYEVEVHLNQIFRMYL